MKQQLHDRQPLPAIGESPYSIKPLPSSDAKPTEEDRIIDRLRNAILAQESLLENSRPQRDLTPSHTVPISATNRGSSPFLLKPARSHGIRGDFSTDVSGKHVAVMKRPGKGFRNLQDEVAVAISLNSVTIDSGPSPVPVPEVVTPEARLKPHLVTSPRRRRIVLDKPPQPAFADLSYMRPARGVTITSAAGEVRRGGKFTVGKRYEHDEEAPESPETKALPLSRSFISVCTPTRTVPMAVQARPIDGILRQLCVYAGTDLGRAVSSAKALRSSLPTRTHSYCRERRPKYFHYRGLWEDSSRNRRNKPWILHTPALLVKHLKLVEESLAERAKTVSRGSRSPVPARPQSSGRSKGTVSRGVVPGNKHHRRS